MLGREAKRDAQKRLSNRDIYGRIYAAAPDTLKLTQLKPSSNASILYTKECNLPVKKKQPMKMAMAP